MSHELDESSQSHELKLCESHMNSTAFRRRHSRENSSCTHESRTRRVTAISRIQVMWISHKLKGIQAQTQPRNLVLHTWVMNSMSHRNLTNSSHVNLIWTQRHIVPDIAVKTRLAKNSHELNESSQPYDLKTRGSHTNSPVCRRRQSCQISSCTKKSRTHRVTNSTSHLNLTNLTWTFEYVGAGKAAKTLVLHKKVSNSTSHEFNKSSQSHKSNMNSRVCRRRRSRQNSRLAQKRHELNESRTQDTWISHELTSMEAQAKPPKLSSCTKKSRTQRVTNSTSHLNLTPPYHHLKTGFAWESDQIRPFQNYPKWSRFNWNCKNRRTSVVWLMVLSTKMDAACVQVFRAVLGTFEAQSRPPT